MGILLGALDIGTQTTTLLAAEYENERLSVVGHVSLQTSGVKKGVIRNIDEVTACVKRARDEMNKLHKVELYDVVASEDGLVTQVEAAQGDALVAEGDTVRRGEVLISGIVTLEPPQYSDLPFRYYTVHARGKVYARTWHTLTAMIPLESQVKAHTGEEKDRWSLDFFGTRLEFYRNSSIPWPSCDKITKVYSLTLPGGLVLPVSLRRETFRAYALETAALSEAAAQDLLEEQLLERLDRRIGEDGTVVSTRFSARVRSGCLEVTLEAECTQEIAQEIPSTREIPAPAG